MAAIQIGQPSYGLLDTNIPAQAALAPIKGAGAVNALVSQNLQNEASQFEMQNALAEREAYKRAAQGEGSVSQNLMGAGLGGKAAAYQKTTAEAQKLGLEGHLKKIEVQQSINNQLAADPSDQNVQSSLLRMRNNGLIDDQQMMQAWSQVRDKTPEQRSQYFTQLSMSAKDAQGLILRQLESDTARQRLQFEMNPTQQANIAQAKATGTETGKSAAKAAADLPNAVDSANQAISLIDEMIGDTKVNEKGQIVYGKKKPHAGFKDYVGASWRPGMRFLEGSDAASYETRQKQIEGQAFLDAFQTLKGGGQITEIEGKKATEAISRMNKAASEAEYIKAARELQEVLRTGVKNAKTKASRGTVGGGAPLPKNKWASALAEFEAQENQ